MGQSHNHSHILRYFDIQTDKFSKQTENFDKCIRRTHEIGLNSRIVAKINKINQKRTYRFAGDELTGPNNTGPKHTARF